MTFKERDELAKMLTYDLDGHIRGGQEACYQLANHLIHKIHVHGYKIVRRAERSANRGRRPTPEHSCQR